jgi:hypothetical protein
MAAGTGNPTVRLAIVANKAACYALDQFEPLPLLCSYAYIRSWQSRVSMGALKCRDWMMDSGGFTAHHTGHPISLVEYTRDCKRMFAVDPTLTEVVQLDKISDWKTSKKNVEYMWGMGVPAIPVWHFGEPESYLHWLAKEFPGKICIGGMVGVSQRQKADSIVYAMKQIWPIRVHALGVSNLTVGRAVPAHSMDATTWVTPYRWGVYERLWGQRLPIRNVAAMTQGIMNEIRGVIRMQAEMERFWRPTWQKIEKDLAPWPLRSM